jgi:hypothetical protein
LQRPRTLYVLIGAAVVALHAAICWLLLSKMRALAVPEVVENLELLWIPALPTRSPVPDDRQNPRAPQPSRPSAASRPAPAPQQNPAPPENNAIMPPIDWQAELDREAQAAAAAKSEPRFKDFGFPRRVSPAAKAPEFAWDRNHTHRVESGAGALVIHINDNCTFVMAPLPFVFCSPGRRPANGGLFGHMKDSPPGADAGAQ